MIKKYNPVLLCLVETRVDETRSMWLCSKFARHWEWSAIIALGFSGGIIIFWKWSIGCVTPIAISQRTLHLIISSSSLDAWILTIVYKAQGLADQRTLWQQLFSIASLNLPWLVTRDFNCISSQEEHKGGEFKYYARKAKCFNHFILAMLCLI